MWSHFKPHVVPTTSFVQREKFRIYLTISPSPYCLLYLLKNIPPLQERGRGEIVKLIPGDLLNNLPPPPIVPIERGGGRLLSRSEISSTLHLVQVYFRSNDESIAPLISKPSDRRIPLKQF